MKLLSAKIYIVLITLTAITGRGVAQQSSPYTQFINNLTPLNSAFSLTNERPTVKSIIRKQWVGIEGAPSMYLINADMPIKSIGGSAGIIIKRDEAAIENLTSVNAFVAKSVQLSANQYLGVSVNAGFRNYNVNFSELNANDASFANNIQETMPNLGLGVMWYSKTYYVGLSAPEINIRSVANQKNSNQYYFSAGLKNTIAKDIQIKPALLIAYAKNIPLVADLSTLFYVKQKFGAGLNYRTTNDLAAIMAVDFDDLHLGYSYQFGTSNTNIGGFNNGTHEIGFGYTFGKIANKEGD